MELEREKGRACRAGEAGHVFVPTELWGRQRVPALSSSDSLLPHDWKRLRMNGKRISMENKWPLDLCDSSICVFIRNSSLCNSSSLVNSIRCFSISIACRSFELSTRSYTSPNRSIARVSSRRPAVLPSSSSSSPSSGSWRCLLPLASLGGGGGKPSEESADESADLEDTDGGNDLALLRAGWLDRCRCGMS
ncbi:hypothetical protein MUK42_26826 [Musa troglodytarum]|uniref:Uncharacterized protein n=1 Tax=Musa troglodytarum TaxID=320322 RepID=A0A9E7GBM6_9LILI|nr:hypothetical protein MUK42_26826 [Musa troglodytarum]